MQYGSYLATGQLNLKAFTLQLTVSVLADPLDGNIGGLPEIRLFEWQDVISYVKASSRSQ